MNTFKNFISRSFDKSKGKFIKINEKKEKKRFLIINEINKKDKFKFIMDSLCFNENHINFYEIEFNDKELILDFFEYILEYKIYSEEFYFLIEFISNIFPITTRPFLIKILQRFQSDISYKIINLLIKKININELDKDNNNSLVYIQNEKHLLILLENGIDINHKNKLGNNFIQSLYIRNKINIINKILPLLKEYKFDFNSKNNVDETFFIFLIRYQYSQMENIICKYNLVNKINFDIINTYDNWLYILFNFNLTEEKKINLLFKMLKIGILEISILNILYDFKHFNNNFPNQEDNIYNLIVDFTLNDKIFTEKCLLSTDNNGNTIIHKLAKNRNKKTLAFIVNNFDIQVNENKDNLFPINLYNNNNLKISLYKLNNIFLF